jgi:hypothetical protein
LISLVQGECILVLVVCFSLYRNAPLFMLGGILILLSLLTYRL